MEGVSRLARVLSISARRFGARPVDFVASIRSRPVDFGAPTPCRHRRQDTKSPIPQSGDRAQLSRGVAPTPCRHRRQDTKKPDSSIGGSGSTIARRRALNLRLIPLANTRASVRSVLRGLARRFCIVMLTSGRRHIVHYTLQNMRIHEQS